MSEKIDVSIIIVNYNTSKLINNCIASIECLTTGISYEIIIIDNNTEDLYSNIIHSSTTNITLIQLKENKGFGKANNIAAEEAKGRYLFFLNPDTILINNAIFDLVKYLDNNPNCGICGGNLYDENKKPVHSYRRVFPSITWELIELSNYKLERLLYGKSSQFNYTQTPLKVAYITGADLMIRTTLFRECRGFSDDFFMYYEETDLCKRIKEYQFKIISLPTARIQHLEGKSYSSHNKNKEFNSNRWNSIFKSRLIYYRRHHSLLYIQLVNIITYMTLFLKAIFGTDKNNRIFQCYKNSLNINND